MENNKFLNEEKYQRSKKKITRIAIVVLVLGVLIGGSLIATGLIKQSKINDKYSESSKAQHLQKLETEKNKINEDVAKEKENLLAKKEEIEQKSKTTINGIQTKIDGLNKEINSLKVKQNQEFRSNGNSEKYYNLDNDIDKKKNEIRELESQIKKEKSSTNIIDDVLNESFNNCAFAEAKNNIYTTKYCSLKDQLKQKNSEISDLDREYSEFNKEFDSHDSLPFYILGAFAIIASCMIAGSIYIITKRREILAFSAQQVMPVAKEGIETMAPTIGKAGAIIAKEISKGIKEGMKDDKE